MVTKKPKKPRTAAGIPVTSRTAGVLAFMAGGKIDGSEMAVRKMLEEEHIRTRDGTRYLGIEDAIAPLAVALEKLDSEVMRLQAKLVEGESTDAFRQYVDDHPPSAEVIALLLVRRGNDIRADAAAKATEKDRARTRQALVSNTKKVNDGKTKYAMATKQLEGMKRNGENVMDSHVAGQIAKSVGCAPKTVRTARTAFLARK
ncbi:MAG: hypothetical protein ABL916_07495 [Burkholderiaceae bacterium]